jgi:hypothetical protein
MEVDVSKTRTSGLASAFLDRAAFLGPVPRVPTKLHRECWIERTTVVAYARPTMRPATLALPLLLAACTRTPAPDGSSGSGASAECPKDLLAAVGTRCSAEGKTCNGGVPDAHRLLMCSSGKWTEMNVPPAPSRS